MVEQRSPKPRAEGSSPSAPAKNREVSTMLTSLFFVSAHKDSATRCGRRPACGACRGGLQPGGLRPGPTEAAAETKSFCPCHKTGENTGFSPVSFFSCVVWLCGAFGFRFWGSPPVRTDCTPLQHPKRTRFRLFRTISGAFRCFYPLLTCKIFGLAFVHLAA